MSWNSLKTQCPWPDSLPAMDPYVHGWVLHEDAWRDTLSRLTDPIVLEVGAWTGKTSLFLLDEFPGLRLVAVDLWNSNFSEYTKSYWSRWISEGRVTSENTMLDLYRVNVARAGHIDRVVTVQDDSCSGMRAVSQHVIPAVVYIDADHSYAAVKRDVEHAIALFPRSIICDDDYEWEPAGVAKAVHEIADRRGFGVQTVGRFWRYV